MATQLGQHPTRELLLGGQKSGKSCTAESRARAWLLAPGHGAILIATALPGDSEMRERIARHRAQRAARTPGLQTLEEPRAVADAIQRLSTPTHMLIVDCLTLWLTQIMLPICGPALDATAERAAADGLVASVRESVGPVVLVSNEIGLGVAPMSTDARRFVDTLGRLHQALGSVCNRVTLMVAGQELGIRGEACRDAERSR